MLTSRRGIAMPIVVLMLVAAGPLSLACRDSKKPATPTATPTTSGTPAPTATPTPPPADPKVGDQFRYQGDFEAAATVYAEVAAQATGDTQQAARLSQAQMLIKLGNPTEAAPVLDAYAATAGAAGDGSDATFLRASTLDDLGDEAGALAAYERYIAAHGVLSDFASIERAKILARLGRSQEADSAARAVLATPGPGLLPAFTASFTLSMGKAFEQGKDDASALTWYAEAKTESGDVASSSARLGGVLKRLGDPLWVSEYQSVLAAYPASGPAAELLDALDEAAVPVDPYVRGVVDYYAGRNTAARTALEALPVERAEATYYLGALAERAGDSASAITLYQRSVELDPQSPLADDALWWSGRLLGAAGQFDGAASAYARLASDYPASKWAADGAFAHGLMLYRGGDRSSAAQIWGTLAGTSEDGLRARFWQGRALKEDNDADGPKILQALVDDPAAAANFYALRAEVLLGKNAKTLKQPKIDASKTDWSRIEQYLGDVRATATAEATASPEPTDATSTATATPPAGSPDDERWEIAASLEAVGLHAQANAELQSLISENAASVDGLLAIVQRMDKDGNTSMEARAATTLLAALPHGAKTLPDDLLRLAYPLAYGDLAKRAADDAGVSPSLLLALVRQESFYDAEAGSTAGALGLTQVVPSTGDSIATQLGVTSFAASDLFRPNVSLRFGASYLATQLSSFDGDAYHALAAYNGGPGAASDAIDIAGSDPDLFVESLEFDETKAYVKLVMENYARYRQLYEDVGRASLPK